jgi:hypothetical protein
MRSRNQVRPTYLATPADIARWDAAFDRFDTLPGEKVYFVPQFRAVGRAAG